MRVLACLLVAGCGDNAVDDTIAPAVLVDTNDDPDIVEVSLVASPATHEYLAGKPADVWAYRDGSIAGSLASIPGPMLEAKLGDHVIVHFTNELPEETTIHWHGLRVPNASDGTPISQVPVPPGGVFDYDFTVVDTGYYWFHPHMRGDVQVEAGLYAPIILRDDVAIDVAADRAFVLDDVKLESTGKLSQSTEALDLMLGRMGNVVIVNGRERPTIEARSGTRERWRFVNAANGRYFNLELPGQTLTVIGVDGGLLVEPYETSTLLIAPGERYEVLVSIADDTVLRTLHYDRGHSIPDPGPIEILGIHVEGAGPAAMPLPATLGHVSLIVTDAATPRRRFVLEENDDIPAMPFFSINAQVFPDITPVRVSTGDVEIWEIENRTGMDHPFHLHGMSFQPIGAPLGWKDTVNVPQRTTVPFAVAYGSPGRWMFHCHILEHAERGMMGELEVAP